VSEPNSIKPTEEITRSIEDIREHGDTMDRERRFKLYMGVPTFGAAAALAGLPLYSHESGGVNWLGSAPVYELGAGMLGIGAYALSRAKNRKAVAAAEEQRVVIGNALQEPVDVVRTKGGKKEPHRLLLHWRGANSLGDDVDEDDLTKRLATIIEFNEANKIDSVMLGADWLKDIVGGENKVTEYGRIVDGRTAVSAHKDKDSPSKRITVTDLYADEHILIATNLEARKLIQKIETDKVQSTISRIMEHVTNETVKRAHSSLTDNDIPHQKFKDIVRFAVEREYDRHTTPGHRKERDEYGGLTIRQRVHSQVTVSGSGHLQEKSQWNDHLTKQAQLGIDGQTSLLRLHGVTSIEELITKITMSKDHDERVTLSALHLTLASQKQYAVPGEKSSIPQPRTLFDRMGDEHLVTLPRLDSLLPEDGDGPTIKYEHAESKIKRRRLAVGVFMATGTFGFALGVPANMTHDYFDQSAKDQHAAAMEKAKTDDTYINEKTGNFDKQQFEKDYEAYLEGAGDSFDRQYLKAYAAIGEFDTNVSQYMLDKYTQVIGSGLAPLSDKWHLKMLDKWRDSTLKTAPTTASSLSSGETGIRDVAVENGETNETIFSVTPLTGKTTKGYWYTDLMSNIDVSSGRLKYSRVSTESDEDSNASLYEIYPSDTTEINSRHPDFMVETPYLLQSGKEKAPVALPMMQGQEVVGLRVEDVSDPTKTMSLTVEKFRSGTARVTIDDRAIEEMRAKGIDHPKLLYWLRGTEETTIRPAGELTYPKGVDMLQISQDVRKALQLTDESTDAEVFNKIRDSKYYSFTPLADAGESLPAPSDDPTKLLTELGTTLAQIDSLNCNLASSLFLLGTAPDMVVAEPPDEPVYMKGLNLATGLYDNGDHKLTQLEGHDWLINGYAKVTDPTPNRSKDGAIDLSPRSKNTEHSTLPNTLPFDSGRIPQAMFGAALLVMAWRRREQIRQSMDETRAQSATRAKSAPEALGTIITAVHGAPGSKMVTLDPNMTQEQIRDKIHTAIPEDGISLREVRARLAEKGIKVVLPVKTQLAIMALGMYDRSIRRTTKKP